MTRDDALEKARGLPWNLTEHQVRKIAAALMTTFADGMVHGWDTSRRPEYMHEPRRIRAEAAALARGE